MDKDRRKELARAYRETVKPMGVFRVLSSSSGRAVVGSSKDLSSILNRHQAQLRVGGHPDKVLQKEWDCLGADAFVFEVLDTLEPSEEPGYDPADDLKALEAMWRERLSTEAGD